MELILGIITIALTSLIGTWLLGFLNQLVPAPARAWLALKNFFSGQRRRADDRFRLVLCWLESDATGADTDTVEYAFRNLAGVTLVRSAKVVRASGAADVWRSAMRKSASAVLTRWNAQLAIVGLVKRSGEVLSLWLIPSDGDGTLDRGDRQPYQLDKVTLGDSFHEDLQVELVTLALAAVAPLANSEARGHFVELGACAVGTAIMGEV